MSLPDEPKKLAERVYILWQLQIIMGTLHNGIDFSTPLMEKVINQSSYEFDIFKLRLEYLMKYGFTEVQE